MPNGNSSPTTIDSAAARIGERLARGDDVSDEEFDAIFPSWVGHLSQTHWTPVAVARAAAEFLVGGGGARAHVLDVGSGPGKFCAIAAAATGARITGIERRRPLVRIARAVAKAVDARGARFIAGAMEDLDWRSFTGIYLYNPFGEHFIDASERIDQADRTGWPLYAHYVRSATAWLYLMRPGTRVVTYHGIGGPMPPGYDLVDSAFVGSGVLRFYHRLDPWLVDERRPPPAMFDEDVIKDRGSGVDVSHGLACGGGASGARPTERHADDEDL